MESERHAFMRKLLQLCVDAKIGEIDVIESVSAPDGSLWISELIIIPDKQLAYGYWDGEKHRVWL
jgi:hypothetical protein